MPVSIRGSLRPPLRHVLVLCEESAHWSRWQGTSLLDTTQRDVSDGCPWLDDASAPTAALQCHVILCDAALDVERLASAGFAPTPLGMWQRLRLMRSRRADPAAPRLAWLGRHSSADARAALQQETVEPQAVLRLESLQRSGLLLSSIQLPETVLASTQARSAPPTLIVLEHPGCRRHVLLVDGVACFARRLVDASLHASDPEDPEGSQALEESLAHCRDRWMLDDIVVSEERDGASPGGSQALARRLTQQARRHRYSPTGVDDLLRPVRAREERVRLGILGLLCCVVAIAAASHMLWAGMTHLRLARELGVERASVLSALQRTQQRSALLHESPERAQAFLDRVDALEARSMASPGIILAAVARSVSSHDPITLDALTWARSAIPQAQDRDRAPDAPLFSDAAGLPVALTLEGHALTIELAGQVDQGLSLRQAQAQVTSLVTALEAEPALHECRLLDSPLDLAADAAHAERAGGHRWRLRCQWQGAGQ